MNIFPDWLGSYGNSNTNTGNTYEALHKTEFNVTTTDISFTTVPSEFSFKLENPSITFASANQEYKFSSIYFINALPKGTL